MLDIATISITSRYSNIDIDIVCVQLFLLIPQNPPKRRFEVENLEFDPACPDINILDPPLSAVNVCL